MGYSKGLRQAFDGITNFGSKADSSVSFIWLLKGREWLCYTNRRKWVFC